MKNTNTIMKKCAEYKYYMIYALIAIWSFVCMVHYADVGSMWYDEMFTFSYALGSAEPNSSFITFALMRWWARMIPYGQTYIYMLSIPFVALTTYIMGLVGKRIRSEMTGVYACAIAAFSPFVWHQAAYEFRMYFMLYFTCALILYFILLREDFKHANSWWFILLYSIVNMLIIDSHEYGKVVGAAIIVLDFLLIVLKVLSKKWIVSFIIPIAYAIYWLLNNDIGHLWNNYAWPVNPTLYTVCQTFFTLLGNSEVLVFLFVVGVIFAIVKVFANGSDEDGFQGSKLGYFTCGYLIVGIFAASIIYSDFVNPANSLYVDRYFLCVVPCIFVVVATALDYIVEAVFKGSSKTIIGVTMVLTLCFIGWNGYKVAPYDHNQPYRQSAELLRTVQEVYEEDSIVFVPDNGYVMASWRYYFQEGGKYDAVNMANKYNFDITNCNYETIYVIEAAYGPTAEQQTYLNENYTLVSENSALRIKQYERVE